MEDKNLLADFSVEKLEERVEAIGITPFNVDPGPGGCCTSGCGGGGCVVDCYFPDPPCGYEPCFSGGTCPSGLGLLPLSLAH